MKATLSPIFQLFLVITAVWTPVQARRRTEHSRSRRADCAIDPQWQPTTAAWLGADTDAQLQSWWDSSMSGGPQSLDNALGRQFGEHLNDFKCGIGQYSTCTAQGCLDFETRGDPVWAYLALSSVTHLNTLFNSIYDGISKGQLGYLGVIDEMATLFFPWKDPTYVGDDASLWVAATLSTVFAAFAAPVAPAAAVALIGTGAFLAAANSQVSHSLSPSENVDRLDGMAWLKSEATVSGEQAREAIEEWSNLTFAGQKDTSGHTILDYMRQGSHIGPQSISNAKIESFWRRVMVSRTINSQWKTRRVFITSAQSADSRVSTGPEESKYYSKEEGRVYYLYEYKDNHLDRPEGMIHLNRTQYDITPQDIIRSSTRAWEHGGTNYTKEMAEKRIQDSLASNGTLTPFLDGPAWEGVWTLPICDVGNRVDWNGKYPSDGESSNSLPCCCGDNCEDTKKFVAAANIKGDRSFLSTCKDQLEGSGIKFDEIDYGYRPSRFTNAQWIGIGAGIGAGLMILLSICCCCCCCR